MKWNLICKKLTCFALAVVLMGAMVPQKAQAAYGIFRFKEILAGMETATEPGTQPAEAAAPKSALPSLETVDGWVGKQVDFDEDLDIEEPGKGDTFTRKYVRKFRCDKEGLETLKGYVDMLCEKRGFTLLSSSNYTEYKGGISFFYDLAYTGSESITGSLSDEQALHIQFFGNGDTRSINGHCSYIAPIVLFSDQADVEAERKKEAEKANNNTNTGGGSYDYEDDDDGRWNDGVEIKCSNCGGDGEVDCGNCGGDGYKETKVSAPNYSGKGVKYETVKEKCYKCNWGKITCSRCGGKGKH